MPKDYNINNYNPGDWCSYEISDDIGYSYIINVNKNTEELTVIPYTTGRIHSQHTGKINNFVDSFEKIKPENVIKLLNPTQIAQHRMKIKK